MKNEKSCCLLFVLIHSIDLHYMVIKEKEEINDSLLFCCQCVEQ